MTATQTYYNEWNPYAAEWLRNLIDLDVIAPGVVDERSIADVLPAQLSEYTQCHFFAGIGVWSYALRSAGWPDTRPVWTISCPCQPFSSAGQGEAFSDERHIWPFGHHLIGECRPPIVLGEQVASKDGLAWLDLVQADMEGTGYAGGAHDLCAAGLGAPSIRQRQYFAFERLADTVRSGQQRQGRLAQQSDSAPCGNRQIDRTVDDSGRVRLAKPTSIRRNERAGLCDQGKRSRRTGPANNGATDRLADTSSKRLQGAERRGSPKQKERSSRHGAECCRVHGMADTKRDGWKAGRAHNRSNDRSKPCSDGGMAAGQSEPGPVNGFWADADWLYGTDGKWRPVEPGTFPLVDGSAFHLGSGGPFEGKSRKEIIKGYGNALNAETATAFCECVLDMVTEREAAECPNFLPPQPIGT